MTANRPDSSKTLKNKVLRVLMIEDDTYYFEYVRQLLLRRTDPSFELHKATTLKEATVNLQEEIPDLILLDLHLPDGKGLECLKAVRELSENCPIIVLTSSDDDALGLRAVASGAHDYLVKQNVSNDSLVRCIRYAIERRKSEEQSLRLAVIQDFTSTLAHDMKMPLIGANKVLDALLSGSAGQLTDEQQQLVSVLKESNANQLTLVHRLLEIYSYESGHSGLSFSSCQVPALIEKLLAVLRQNYSGTLIFNDLLEPDNSWINADQQALERLLLSLLDNAVKFADKEKPITVQASMRGSKLELSVHNFGKPIPDDIKDNLFQKFWSGVPGKRYVAQTGLGLYLCFRIVQLHQGRISCQSDEATGTTISVALPV
jgi:signal transduction histidine kinase